MSDDPYGTIRKFDAAEMAKFRAERLKKKPTAEEAKQAAEAAKQAAEAAKQAAAPAPVAPAPTKAPAAAAPAKAPAPVAKAPAPTAAPAPQAVPARPPDVKPKPKLGTVQAKPLPEAVLICPLSDDAKQLLREDLTLVPYLHLLVQNKLFSDAVRLVAYAVPQREAVWWACQCARSVAGKEPPPAVEAALQAAEKWVEDPSENHRRLTMPAAEAVGFGTPAGCAALAAFWSGGSLAPPDCPVVPPPPNLTPRGAANGVLLSGLIKEPEKVQDRYFQFVTEGIKIAMGLNPWTTAGKNAPK